MQAIAHKATQTALPAAEGEGCGKRQCAGRRSESRCCYRIPSQSPPSNRKGEFALYQWFLFLGNGNPLQDSCLENPMARGAWRDTIHGLTKSDGTDHTHTHTHSCKRNHMASPFLMQTFKLSSLKVKIKPKVQLSLLLLKTLLGIFKNA